MPLNVGTTLGPYSVTAKSGQGGMGEVYQAGNTKLDRDVALKVPDLTRDETATPVASQGPARGLQSPRSSSCSTQPSGRSL